MLLCQVNYQHSIMRYNNCNINNQNKLLQIDIMDKNFCYEIIGINT
ncbi:unnamed protein product [Paramecium octaurelia]|uniref:Uncharacterized protein n=1 Tax=Paramecium octaurelia TaxID=43137 RepID=A0A8S1XDF1_PAROT|nr:unnamed protein product [Paramecium octaurelia]